MMILGIETAVEHVGVALGDHRGTLASATVNSDRRHAESLAPMIEFVCAQAGVTLRQLDAVAVDVGIDVAVGAEGLDLADGIVEGLPVPEANVVEQVAVFVGVEGGVEIGAEEFRFG